MRLLSFQIAQNIPSNGRAHEIIVLLNCHGSINTVFKKNRLKIYLKDRTGDTFRWRGENVSTSEVETVIANICNHKEAVCYGVEIPGTEGKAGMVAILDPEHSINLKLLASQINKKLPKYARPRGLQSSRQVSPC